MENENKFNEAIRSIFDSLTDEQKEKASACKTMDELVALAGKEGIELPDEMLDSIAGGAFRPFVRGMDTCYMCGESEYIDKMMYISIDGMRQHVCCKCAEGR